MPKDVTDVGVFNQRTAEFLFHEEAISANILLADEINRAMPQRMKVWMATEATIVRSETQ